MLHGIKLAISRRGEREIIDSDQQVREADKLLTQLQRWFPQLQALIDENEKIWASLGYNICSVANTAQQVYDDENGIHFMLQSLYSAGDTLISPIGYISIFEERRIASIELRTFNENIRQLRILQTDCVTVLKNRTYYVNKLKNIRQNEGKKTKSKKISERDTDRRVRNEQKLADYSNQAFYQVERLRKELEMVINRKEIVTGLVLSSYIRTQDFFLGRNPMPPVLSLLTTHGSVRNIFEIGNLNENRKVESMYDSGIKGFVLKERSSYSLYPDPTER